MLKRLCYYFNSDIMIIEIKEGGQKMKSELFKDLLFYCWQLDIKTFGQLAEFKAQHEATTNKKLLNALCKAYNS